MFGATDLSRSDPHLVTSLRCPEKKKKRWGAAARRSFLQKQKSKSSERSLFRLLRADFSRSSSSDATAFSQRPRLALRLHSSQSHSVPTDRSARSHRRRSLLRLPFHLRFGTLTCAHSAIALRRDFAFACTPVILASVVRIFTVPRPHVHSHRRRIFRGWVRSLCVGSVSRAPCSSSWLGRSPPCLRLSRRPDWRAGRCQSSSRTPALPGSSPSAHRSREPRR